MRERSQAQERRARAAHAALTATRHGRRKLRTRGRLIEAVRRVVGRKGAEAATIQDITEEADVGFGTFYNHFPSKEAILEAATAEATEELGRALDPVRASIEDPAEVISVAVRHLTRLVDHDPIWGWFLVRVGLYQEQMAAFHAPRFAQDVRRGIKAGRFGQLDLELVSHAVGGAIWAVLQAKLTGRLGPDADVELAATVLRILGLTARDARAVASRPLPDIGLASRERRI